jgi:hypothetical protein
VSDIADEVEGSAEGSAGLLARFAAALDLSQCEQAARKIGAQWRRLECGHGIAG